MAIDIKELFKTDLDANSILWWSNDKIDKINHNFKQLLSGGMPGPQGLTGFYGGFGNVGIAGVLGDDGAQGPQGTQGPALLSGWVYYPDTINSIGYLFPKRNAATITQYSPSPLLIGVDGGDSLYNPPSLWYKYVVLSNVNSPTQVGSIRLNLRIQHDDKTADFKLTKDPDPAMYIGKLDSTDVGFKLEHISGNTILKSITPSNTTPTNAHEINDTLIKINPRLAVGVAVEATADLSNVAGKNTKSNHTLIYDKTAQIDNVLVSSDVAGTSNWVDKKTMFNDFPVGSIISIREEDFNYNNFYLDEAIIQTGLILSALSNRYGKGKPDTPFMGWYLCNGEYWKEGTTYILTPNLNSFNSVIDGNGGNQPAVIGGDDSPILVAGYDIGLNASVNDSGVYSISFTNTFDDNDTSSLPDEIILGAGSGARVNRMVHLVYLENKNLTWSRTYSGATAPSI